MKKKINLPLAGLSDVESDGIPVNIPRVIDAHVHLFPDELFHSIWKWFEHHAWPIRYKLPRKEIVQFLLKRGVRHMVLLHYAHKPGIASELNDDMATFCSENANVTGLATVFPGEDHAKRILETGFKNGLAGVKLHSHVQCFDMESPAMDEIYQTCVDWDMPLTMHVGREPKSPAYPCDPYLLCSAEKLNGVLKKYPKLRVCVPHLGADEFSAYMEMVEKHDNLWLDTAMVLAGYLPVKQPDISMMRLDRLIYGSDFPNLPYAWDRELKKMALLGLSEEAMAHLFSKNAMAFYSIPDLDSSQG
jgi:predicted TIM-barrel fold metal-dependent hydrolase